MTATAKTKRKKRAPAKKKAIPVKNYRVETLDGCYVSARSLAELIGVTPEMLRRYVNDYGMPRESRGKYLLRDSMQWYIKRLKITATGGENNDIAEEKLKLVRAQRHRVELDNKKVRGELIDHDTVAGAFHQMGAVFASQLDSLGARMAGVLSNITDPGEIQRVIFNECRGIRDTTAAVATDLAVNYDHGGDNPAATIEGRGKVG